MLKTIQAYTTVSFVLLYSFFVSAVEAQVRFLDTRTEEIQQILDTHVGCGDAGVVIGIVDEFGSRILCAGKMGDGSDREVDGDSIFEIGSVTKVFSSLLLMDAVSRGEMRLDDPVNEYLPEGVNVPAHGRKCITLVHLAAHESSFPFNPDNFPEGRGNHVDTYTVEDLYRFLKDYKLTSVPGAGFSYSNVGYALLGHALERRAGSSFKSLIAERIFRPLEMESTSINLDPQFTDRLTNGHLPDGKSVSHIKRINGASVKGKTAKECLSMMAGPSGTTVQLQLIHPETKEVSTFNLIKRKYLNILD